MAKDTQIKTGFQQRCVLPSIRFNASLKNHLLKVKCLCAFILVVVECCTIFAQLGFMF